MFKQAYNVAPELAPGIHQKQFPLPANLVTPLTHFPKDAETPRSAAPTTLAETATEKVVETPKAEVKSTPKKEVAKPEIATTKVANNEEVPELEDEFQAQPFTGDLF